MFDVSTSLTGNNLQSPADGQKVGTHSSEFIFSILIITRNCYEHGSDLAIIIPRPNSITYGSGNWDVKLQKADVVTNAFCGLITKI